jgi:hypothetical protein
MSNWRIQMKCKLRWSSIGKIRIQVALEDPSAGSKSSFALKDPLRSRAESDAYAAHYAGRSTDWREDDQEDRLVELQGSSRTHAGKSLYPRRAQLKTELIDDDGESSGERSGADEGSCQQIRRAPGHSCGRLSTLEFTSRMRQSYCIRKRMPPLTPLPKSVGKGGRRGQRPPEAEGPARGHTACRPLLTEVGLAEPLRVRGRGRGK